MVADLHPRTVFVDGEFVVPKSTMRFTVTSPNTAEEFASVPAGSTEDVDLAVAAARRVFDDPQGWSQWEPFRRAEALERLAVLLESRGEELAQTVSAQNGMPIGVSRATQAGLGPMVYRYYAGLARDLADPDVRAGILGGQAIVDRMPVGVVAAIVPWNFPQSTAAMKMAPALAAGCTVVLKPSPETVLDSYLLAEAVVEAGIPAGVVNIVPGGRDIGAYLVGHPGVDKVSFTGSTLAGRQIAETCGRLLRPVTLELGGKSAAILLDDLDLDLLGAEFFGATLFNNGQTCFLGTRILAPRRRYDEVVDFVASLAAGAVVGDSLDEATEIGPMTSSRQRERVERYIAQGVAEGSTLVTGGGRPADLPPGWFVEPTVFAHVTNDQTIAREEIFGPVLCVIPYDTVDDAVAIANDSDYGLGGSVWGADGTAAQNVASRVRSGTVGVNGYSPDPVAPYGGIGSSGMGRELGPEGMAEYQLFRSIYLPAPRASAGTVAAAAPAMAEG